MVQSDLSFEVGNVFKNEQTFREGEKMKSFEIVRRVEVAPSNGMVKGEAMCFADCSVHFSGS